MVRSSLLALPAAVLYTRFASLRRREVARFERDRKVHTGVCYVPHLFLTISPFVPLFLFSSRLRVRVCCVWLSRRKNQTENEQNQTENEQNLERTGGSVHRGVLPQPDLSGAGVQRLRGAAGGRAWPRRGHDAAVNRWRACPDCMLDIFPRNSVSRGGTLKSLGWPSKGPERGGVTHRVGPWVWSGGLLGAGVWVRSCPSVFLRASGGGWCAAPWRLICSCTTSRFGALVCFVSSLCSVEKTVAFGRNHGGYT